MLFMTNQTYGSPADDELKIQISSALVGDCRIDHSTTWSTSEQKKNIDFRRNNRYKIAIIAEPNFVQTKRRSSVLDYYFQVRRLFYGRLYTVLG